MATSTPSASSTVTSLNKPAKNPVSNPFDNAFEMLGLPPETSTGSVNAEALEQLTAALTSRASNRGRMILLRSPRAGFGKTHLLLRLHQRVAHSHEFIPLEPSKGRYLDAQSVLDAVLRRFSRILPAGGGMTVLDLLARRIFATGLEPLVRSGEVPSQDRNSALEALQMRPVETFDFHSDSAVTAGWAKANFTQLGPRLTAELAERVDAGFRPVAWWVELLFRYSTADLEQNTRNSSLFETVFGDANMETDMHEKLVTLLNLTGLVTSPVLVLDEVEGFSSNPEAALQVATFLNALHQSCSKLALIVSVNGDVWETAFLPRLPCGLKDRLSDIIVDLKPLDASTAEALIRDRAGEHAPAILDDMDFDTGVVYARGVVREASKKWEEYSANFIQPQRSDASTTAEPISLSQPVPAAPVAEPVIEPAVDELQSAPVIQPVEEVEALADQPEVREVVENAPVENDEPSSDDYAAFLANPAISALVESGDQEENLTEEVAPPSATPEPTLDPASEPLPDPFGRGEQSAPAATPAPEPDPAPQEPQLGPSNIVNSPFAIDTSAAPVSPFQLDPNAVAPAPDTASPFQVESNQPQQPAPHSVTDNDHEKVEDLLRQFRDRYGRDDE